MARCSTPAGTARAAKTGRSTLKTDDIDQELVLEDLTREQVLDWRTCAATDHHLVFDHIDRYGEYSAQRLFTWALVAQVQRLSGLEHLDLGVTPWGQA